MQNKCSGSNTMTKPKPTFQTPPASPPSPPAAGSGSAGNPANPSDMGNPMSQEEKLEKCINALEFIAFNNHPCWKDRDRKRRAMQTLLDIGTHVRVTPNSVIIQK
jgi:hypothetical protein